MFRVFLLHKVFESLGSVQIEFSLVHKVKLHLQGCIALSKPSSRKNSLITVRSVSIISIISRSGRASHCGIVAPLYTSKLTMRMLLRSAHSRPYGLRPRAVPCEYLKSRTR